MAVEIKIYEIIVVRSMLTIDIAVPDTSDHISNLILQVTIAATDTNIMISVNDGDGNIEINHDSYNYVWSELNGYLTTQEIQDFQVNDNENGNSNYLILDRTTLTEEITCEFQVQFCGNQQTKISQVHYICLQRLNLKKAKT